MSSCDIASSIWIEAVEMLESKITPEDALKRVFNAQISAMQDRCEAFDVEAVVNASIEDAIDIMKDLDCDREDWWAFKEELSYSNFLASYDVKSEDVELQEIFSELKRLTDLQFLFLEKLQPVTKDFLV